MDDVERRRQQNLRSGRGDARGVTPSSRAFAQAIDRGAPERIPVLKAARPDLLEVACALDAAEVAALAIHIDDPQAELAAFAAAAKVVTVPVLRTDLILEEFQIYESRAAGADALVLRADVLGDQLARLARLAASTHMAPCIAGAPPKNALELRGDELYIGPRHVATLDRTIADASDPAAAFRALLEEP